MSLDRRLSRLEEQVPQPPEPLEVVVRRRIVRPTPDGPMTTGERVARYLDGRRVESDPNNQQESGT